MTEERKKKPLKIPIVSVNEVCITSLNESVTITTYDTEYNPKSLMKIAYKYIKKLNGS